MVSSIGSWVRIPNITAWFYIICHSTFNHRLGPFFLYFHVLWFCVLFFNKTLTRLHHQLINILEFFVKIGKPIARTLSLVQNRVRLKKPAKKGSNGPTPMIALVPFGMNSSSSQLLDLLQALRLGHFILFFPSLTSRLPIKKMYLTA